MASTEPWVSALTIILSVLLLLASSVAKRFSSVTLARASWPAGGAGGELAFLGEVAGGLFILNHGKFLAGLGHAVQPKHFHSHRGAGFLEPLVLLIDERAHAPVILAAKYDVAHAQGALAHQHGGGGAAGFQAGLDDVALGIAVRVGLQLQQVGLEQDHLDKLVHAQLGQAGAFHENGIATPVVGNQPVFLQLLAHAHGVGVRMVDLVDRHDDRHLGRARMVQGLQRLRHDAVVGRNDQDDDVRDVRAARAHGAEGLVAGRVQKRELLDVLLALGMRE